MGAQIDHNINTRQCIANQQPNGCGQFLPSIIPYQWFLSTNTSNQQPMTGGILKSDPSFSPGIDAEFVGTGNDYIHADPDGQHLRLNAHGVVKYVL